MLDTLKVGQKFKLLKEFRTICNQNGETRMVNRELMIIHVDEKVVRYKDYPDRNRWGEEWYELPTDVAKVFFSNSEYLEVI